MDKHMSDARRFELRANHYEKNQLKLYSKTVAFHQILSANGWVRSLTE
jgi:hypothetical protein